MFTAEELQSIDRNYFRVIGCSCFSVTLQSRNTGHCWHILQQEYGRFSTCTIFHTHHYGTAYHKHGHAKNLMLCIRQIISHDTWWLGRQASRFSHIHQKIYS